LIAQVESESSAGITVVSSGVSEYSTRGGTLVYGMHSCVL
jgi:hypothetical protein